MMDEKTYESLPDDLKDTYNRYCLNDDFTGLSMNSIILSDDNRRQVDDLIRETQFKEKFIEKGLQPINRVLCYGASGTGKTF